MKILYCEYENCREHTMKTKTRKTMRKTKHIDAGRSLNTFQLQRTSSQAGRDIFKLRSGSMRFNCSFNQWQTISVDWRQWDILGKEGRGHLQKKEESFLSFRISLFPRENRSLLARTGCFCFNLHFQIKMTPSWNKLTCFILSFKLQYSGQRYWRIMYDLLPEAIFLVRGVSC